MPPSTLPPQQSQDTSHMLRPPVASGEGGLPPHQQSSVGPIVGAVIVILVLAFGALYFWGAHLNKDASQENQLPFIPAENPDTTNQ